MNGNNIKEFIKQKQNPIYFIENYIKIFNQRFGYIPFKMYDVQKSVISLWLKQNNLIILKSRQTGISTLLQQLQLWLQLFYDNYYIGIISIEESRQIEFLRGIKYLYHSIITNHNFDKIKSFLPKPSKEIEKTFQFQNHSRILQGNTNNPFRGYPLSLIIVDEQQFVPNLKEQLDAIAPTLQTVQKQGIPHGIILNSTPNGVQNYYYILYKNQMPEEEFKIFTEIYNVEYQKKEQRERYNGYVRMKIHWKEIPEFDQEWYEIQKQMLGNDQKQISQELELNFIQSGDTLIQQDVLQEIEQKINTSQENYKIVTYTDEITNKTYHIKTYVPPEENETYFMGIDTQYSIGQDNSQIVVIRQSDQKVVATFQDQRINDRELQNIQYYLQEYYNNQWIGIEISQVGTSVIRQLVEDFNYKNIYQEQKNKNIKKDKSSTYEKEVFGVQVTQITRPIIIQTLKNYVETSPQIVTEDIFRELQTFIRQGQNNKYQQTSGQHDDLVMQFQIQLYIRDQLMQKSVKRVQTKIDITQLSKLHNQKRLQQNQENDQFLIQEEHKQKQNQQTSNNSETQKKKSNDILTLVQQLNFKSSL